jgi:ATP-dependent Clp protease ATP-binding subunit ClpB
MGSAYIQEQFEKINAGNREHIIEETKERIMEMLKKNIRPEFLNRIDETIMFTPLDEGEIEQIVRLQAKAITTLLHENEITLHITDAAVKFIAQAGFDPEFGARPIKRAMQRLLLNDLSKQMLAGTVDKANPVIVDSDGERLIFSNR